MIEKFPEWKALVELPSVGNIIDIINIRELREVGEEFYKDTYSIMSLESMFEHIKKHNSSFIMDDYKFPEELKKYIYYSIDQNNN